MAWPGGKSGMGVYHRLCAEVPPHDERISPFGGHCAVMRHLRPADGGNVVCDLDESALELWREFTWSGTGRRPTLIRGCGIDHLRHRFGLRRWPTADLLHPSAAFAAVYRGKILKPDDCNTACSDALRSGGGRAVPFVFVDPPYPMATLTSGVCPYKFGMTDDQHGELLQVIRSLPALVMVVSYPNDLYATELRDWRTFRYRAFTRGGEREEQAWCNYPPPRVLHDWRYAGRDRRARERIARRVRNWRRMYADLPPPERAAILDALQGVEARSAESTYHVFCDRCLTIRPDDVESCPVCVPGTAAGAGGSRSRKAKR